MTTTEELEVSADEASTPRGSTLYHLPQENGRPGLFLWVRRDPENTLSGALVSTRPDDHDAIVSVAYYHDDNLMRVFGSSPWLAYPGDRTSWMNTVDTLVNNHGETRKYASRLAEQVGKLEAKLRAAEVAVDPTVAELEAKLAEANSRNAMIWEVLEREAESREWCSDYDDFAEEHAHLGARARLREWESPVLVTLRVYVNHSARSYAEAQKQALEQFDLRARQNGVTVGRYRGEVVTVAVEN